MVIGLMLFIAIMIFNERSIPDIITTLGVFVAASFRLLPSINRIIVSLQSIKFLEPSLDIIFNEMKLENLSISVKPKKKVQFDSDLTVNNLSFKFSRELPLVLNNINFKIFRHNPK